MSDRNLGSVVISSNLDPRISGPLDIRDIVSNYNELIDPDIWITSDGESYVYKGMEVVVTDDPNPLRNGKYRLVDLPSTKVENWLFIELGLDKNINNLTSEGLEKLLNYVSIKEAYYAEPVIFTESGSYNITDSGRYIVICGAGGSGGCGNGGGGAGGSTASTILEDMDGTSLSITVGVGGNGYILPSTGASLGGNSFVRNGNTTLVTTTSSTACSGTTGGKGTTGSGGFTGGDGETIVQKTPRNGGYGGNGAGYNLPGFGFEYLADILKTPTGENGTQVISGTTAAPMSSGTPGLATIAGGGGGGGSYPTGTATNANGGAGGRGSVVIIPIRYRVASSPNYCCIINGDTTTAYNEVQDDKLGVGGSVDINNIYTLTNPFGDTTYVQCNAELFIDGKWMMSDGVVATYIQGFGIYVQTKDYLYKVDDVPVTTTTKCRVHVVKPIGNPYGESMSSEFELTPATTSKLGGIKVGAGLTVSADGTLSTVITNDDLTNLLSQKADKVTLDNLSARVDTIEELTIPLATPDTPGGLTYAVDTSNNSLLLDFTQK